jgi:hypothetical protein
LTTFESVNKQLPIGTEHKNPQPYSSSIISNFATMSTTTSTTNADHSSFDDVRDKKGAFNRPAASFRNWISSAPGSRFPPAPNRYVLYINRGCPWAHRTKVGRL